jgi:hypothetical protein
VPWVNGQSVFSDHRGQQRAELVDGPGADDQMMAKVAGNRAFEVDDIVRAARAAGAVEVDRPGKFGGPYLPNTVMLPARLAEYSSFPRILSG